MFKSIFICSFFIACYSKDMVLAQNQTVVRLITVTPEKQFTKYFTIQPDDEGNYDLLSVTNFSSPREYTDFIVTRSSDNEYAESRHPLYPFNLTICNFSPDGFDDQGLAIPERFQLVIAPKCDYDRLFAAWSSTEMKLAQGQLVVMVLTSTVSTTVTNYVTIQPNEKGRYDFSAATNFTSQADFLDFLKQSDQYRGVIRTRENSSNYNLAICHFAPVKAKNLYTVDFTKNISDYPFDQFESYVQPACYTLGEEYVLQASSFT